MFLFFNGCSYTKGYELDDWENDRFSTLVSNHFKADHKNIARGGQSNDQIVLRSLEFLENNSCDYAIIMLTHCQRNTFNGPSRDNKKLYPRLDRYFYENYYDDILRLNGDVGRLNFYKNRYILEQEFKKRNIPLLLLQYHDVQGKNYWRRMCNGEIQTVADRYSPEIFFGEKKSLLGLFCNKKYYYNDNKKEILFHFNIKGHRKIADYIIGELTSTI